ncbi:response regulator [Flavobacterium sp.]|uniref:response regulator n=1 Tax=Flavobacterium sp. TaxID=239 RepID=UPI0025C0E204|nr:response regulator [Flavobacterium sp.]
MNFPNIYAANHWFHVDDDQDDLAVYSDIISEVAPEVKLEQFGSSLALIRKLNASDVPKLILIDLNMPVVDGLGCLKHVKIIPHVKDFSRLVILSTNSNKEMIDYCYAMGAHYYAIKPSDPEQIRELMLKLVAISKTEPRFPIGKKQYLLTP